MSRIWRCYFCNKQIKIGEQTFARVTEYGDKLIRGDGQVYKLKKYKRFHIDCAGKLKNLNEHELALLFNIGENGLKEYSNKPLGIDTSSLKTILEALEIYGYKLAYGDSDSILLKKTGVALDTP